jgi:hypothetical protein
LIRESGFLRRFAKSAGGRVAAANAADGRELGLHDQPAIAAFLAEALVASQKLAPADQTEDGFNALLRNVCYGRRGPGGVVVPSSHLFSCPISLPKLTEDWFCVVMSAGRFVNLMADADRDRLFSSVTMTSIVSGEFNFESDAEAVFSDLAPARRLLRRFKLAPPRGTVPPFGNPLVWMTGRTVVESLLTSPLPPGGTLADLVTDRLGVIFPAKSAARATPKARADDQRVLLHIPASVVLRGNCYRPTVFEAGQYPRFMARSRNGATAPDDWGQTLDLEPLSADGSFNDGLPEIVRDTISPDHFGKDDYIYFDYLGPLTRRRGEKTGKDTDADVANGLLAPRSCATAVHAARSKRAPDD